MFCNKPGVFLLQNIINLIFICGFFKGLLGAIIVMQVLKIQTWLTLSN